MIGRIAIYIVYFIIYSSAQPITASNHQIDSNADEIHRTVTEPKYMSLLHLLSSWNPLDIKIPQNFKESLAIFNFSSLSERKLALRYREAGIPFKVNTVPYLEIAKVKWTDEYVKESIDRKSFIVERSATPRYLYWNVEGRNISKNYIPPTSLVKMKFEEWAKIAHAADKSSDVSSPEYFYLHVNSGRDYSAHSHFISRDLLFFSTKRNNLFIPNVRSNLGTECRFGMRGIIAEAHCDTSNNMIALIRGKKRLILATPASCQYLNIIADRNNPSFRQCSIDWTNIPSENKGNFSKVDAIETVLLPGEILYVPNYWFHYVVSLEYNIQCNAFSKESNKKKQMDVNSLPYSIDCLNSMYK